MSGNEIVNRVMACGVLLVQDATHFQLLSQVGIAEGGLIRNDVGEFDLVLQEKNTYSLGLTPPASLQNTTGCIVTSMTGQPTANGALIPNDVPEVAAGGLRILLTDGAGAPADAGLVYFEVLRIPGDPIPLVGF